jgi:hypothetical protein
LLFGREGVEFRGELRVWLQVVEVWMRCFCMSNECNIIMLELSFSVPGHYSFAGKWIGGMCEGGNTPRTQSFLWI